MNTLQALARHAPTIQRLTRQTPVEIKPDGQTPYIERRNSRTVLHLGPIQPETLPPETALALVEVAAAYALHNENPQDPLTRLGAHLNAYQAYHSLPALTPRARPALLKATAQLNHPLAEAIQTYSSHPPAHLLLAQLADTPQARQAAAAAAGNPKALQALLREAKPTLGAAALAIVAALNTLQPTGRTPQLLKRLQAKAEQAVGPGVKEYIQYLEGRLTLNLLHRDPAQAIVETAAGSPDPLQAALRLRLAVYAEALRRNPQARQRLLDTILNRQTLARLASLAQRRRHGISTHPVQAAPVKPGRPNFAIIYSDPSFEDALHELAQEAAQLARLRLLAVQPHWLETDGETVTATRAVVLHGTPREAPLNPPAPIHAAAILGLEISREKALHRKLSRLLQQAQVAVINPHQAAARIDSKTLTHRLIEEYRQNTGKRIQTPRYTPIPRHTLDPLPLLQRLARETGATHIVVKPDHGTEALMAAAYPVRRLDKAAHHLSEILRLDDAIAEEYRGNPQSPAVIRVTVSLTDRYRVEGAYTVKAKPGSLIAATTHGGHIAPPPQLPSETWAQIRQAVIHTAEALNQGLDKPLKYLGVDIVLENSQPIILEVNSRPSGLTHLVDPQTRLPNIMSNLLKHLDLQTL